MALAINDEYTDAYFGNPNDDGVVQNDQPDSAKPLFGRNSRKSIQINGNGAQIIALTKNNQSFSINSRRDNMFGNDQTPNNYISFNDGVKPNVKDYQGTSSSAYSFRASKYKKSAQKNSNRSYADLGDGQESLGFFESGGFSMAAVGENDSHGDSMAFDDVDASMAMLDKEWQ